MSIARRYLIAIVSAAIVLAAAGAPALAAFDTYGRGGPGGSGGCTLSATACAVHAAIKSNTPGPGFGAAVSTAARS